jgi:hypothetical protein
MNHTVAQADLDFNIEQPDWVALKLLIAKIDEELAQERKHLLMKLSNWFLALQFFRDFEDKRFFLAEPSDRDREYHRVFLTHLMAHGELLALELRKHQEIDPKHIGLNQADVDGAVQYLRDCFAEWYSEVSESRKEEILREVFGEPQSGTWTPTSQPVLISG